MLCSEDSLKQLPQRVLLCAALGLVRCRVPPSVWTSTIHEALADNPPKDYQHVLNAIVTHYEFERAASDEEKRALEVFSVKSAFRFVLLTCMCVPLSQVAPWFDVQPCDLAAASTVRCSAWRRQGACHNTTQRM